MRSQLSMQKVRCNRVSPEEQPSLADTVRLKATQTASSGQAPGSQLKMVQYPPGWVGSQNRSSALEQSVESWHLSPISGEQLSSSRQARKGARNAESMKFGGTLAVASYDCHEILSESAINKG